MGVPVVLLFVVLIVFIIFLGLLTLYAYYRFPLTLEFNAEEETVEITSVRYIIPPFISFEISFLNDLMRFVAFGGLEEAQVLLMHYIKYMIPYNLYLSLFVIPNHVYNLMIFTAIGGAVVTSIFILFQLLAGPSMIKRSLRLRYLETGENPWLEKTVGRLAEKSGLPKPKIAIWPSEQPNACVFGRTTSSATLAVSDKLLFRLNKDEVRATIGHEMGHLKHKDYLIMTCLGSIPLIWYRLGRFILYNEWGRPRSVKTIIIFGWIAVIAFLVYAVTDMIVLTLSRMREYYSDAYAAYLTRNPRALRSALTKIIYGLSITPQETYGANAFLIEDPGNARNQLKCITERRREYDLDKDGTLDEKELQKAMEKEAKKITLNRLKNMFSTHPPHIQAHTPFKPDRERDGLRNILHRKHIQIHLNTSIHD